MKTEIVRPEVSCLGIQCYTDPGLCDRCELNKAEPDHPCSWSEEMNHLDGEEVLTCNCCDDCTTQCFEDT